jgi:2-oxo-4-hydroxy-4-carboxy--5-ureidoimidazoline (OHCU) decarboxylase
MPYIPYDAVVGRIEDMVQGDSEFNHSQACTKVASCARYRIEQIVPQLVCQAHKIVALELP